MPSGVFLLSLYRDNLIARWIDVLEAQYASRSEAFFLAFFYKDGSHSIAQERNVKLTEAVINGSEESETPSPDDGAENRRRDPQSKWIVEKVLPGSAIISPASVRATVRYACGASVHPPSPSDPN